MNKYELKQAMKKERFEELADKARNRSEQHYKASNNAVAGIPFGQPILIGHHSESKHRNALKRSHNHMDKFCAEHDKAKYYDDRAASVGKAGISSDDPEAVTKLKEKLARLEFKQEEMKRINREFKKNGGDLTKIEADPALLKEGASTLAVCAWHKKPFPFMGTDSANIRRVKERIKTLEAAKVAPEHESITGDGFNVYENRDENRVCFDFHARPSKEVCRIMGGNGWRWNRTLGVWTRHLNNASWYSAERTIKEIGELH